MSLQFKTTASEFKFVSGDAKTMIFSGYASKFGGVDSYGDTIAPGAYTETLKNRERPVLLRWSHWGDVIGKWTTIKEDEVGLYVEGELTPGHSKAEDVYALIKHGAISGLSIGYRPVEIEETIDGENVTRLLKRIDLVEISVVEQPADIGAQIDSVKNAGSLKEIEAVLRLKGFSQSEATAIVARVKSLSHGERDDEGKAIADLIGNFKIL